MLWKRAATLEQLNQQSQGCMVGHLGIEFTRLSDDELEATMPVDSRTTQPLVYSMEEPRLYWRNLLAQWPAICVPWRATSGGVGDQCQPPQISTLRQRQRLLPCYSCGA